MIKLGVMLLLAISSVTITMVWGACYDYTCKRGIPPETMYVDKGDKCAYILDKYPPPSGADCFVKYKMGTCRRIQFNCKSLNLWNRSPKCYHPDKMIIYRHEDQYPWSKPPYWIPTRKFCQNRTPRKIRSINGLRIRLRISKHTKGGKGARECFIECLD